MSARGEGERFLVAFQALKTATHDDPDRLKETWRNDARLQKLCDEVSDMIAVFLRIESSARQSFTPHVPAAAIQARADYESRWQSVVGEVTSRDWEWLFADIAKDWDSSTEAAFDGDFLAEEITAEKRNAKSAARSLEHIIDYAAEKRADDGDNFFEWAEEGLEAWHTLKSQCGLDVSGALWRRRMVPHILIPSHVSARYGSGNASLYRRLIQAADAFVFGAPLAALAMQRAVLEQVLKDHWKADKGHIRNANLPELAWDSRADRLKNRAGEALHASTDKLKGDGLDRMILENFGLLKLLIENVPAALKPN